jgi:trans-aconitate 2-methyltransferase
MSVTEFYDNFISYQINSGINDRIYKLYKRLCKIGISTETNILEIGCGIGSLTYLISRKIKKGRIEAMDISQKSIEYAKTNLIRSNVYFSSSNVLEFEPSSTNFDKILLFDILEHIPEENHGILFEKISKWMNDNSLLLINLPNPNSIIFDQKIKPEVLQEIDQPIFIDKLAKVLANVSLDIEYLDTYSVWVKNDYQFYVIKKRIEYVESKLSSERNMLDKIIIRSGRILRKLIYRYPVKNR